MKDAESYISPHLTISVSDREGHQSEPQDTPSSNNLKPNYVHFGDTIHIQTTLEELQEKGGSVFIEFKHYKPKKKKISTRCFAVLEYDEIVKAKNQQICLELYQKPTDFTKRRLNLFTIKKLYLHLTVQHNQH